MSEKHILYRGFMLTIKKRPELDWCVRYESTNGEIIRQAYNFETEGAAIEHAQSKIDTMIIREDREQEQLRPWERGEQ